MRKILALFDLDRTLLDGSSGVLYIRYLRKRGDVGRAMLLRSYWYAALYRMGFFDYPKVAAKLALAAAEQSEEQARLLCQQWFDDVGVHHLAQRGIARLQAHQDQGHLVAIISASTPYIVGPCATHLGVADYLCTRLVVEAGRLTGRIVDPPCYGPHKVYWASTYAEEHEASLEDAYFYSDGISDLPLLQAVGHPVAVNPDPRLRAHATQRGWPIERFY